MFENTLHGFRLLMMRPDILAFLGVMSGATIIISTTFNNLTVRRLVSMSIAVLVTLIGFQVGRITLIGKLIAELPEGHTLTAYLYMFGLSLIGGLWIGKAILVLTRSSRRKFWLWASTNLNIASMKALSHYENCDPSVLESSVEAVAIRAHKIMNGQKDTPRNG